MMTTNAKSRPNLATQLGLPEPAAPGPVSRRDDPPGPSTGSGKLSAILDAKKEELARERRADWTRLVISCAGAEPPPAGGILKELERHEKTPAELERAIQGYRTRLSWAGLVDEGKAAGPVLSAVEAEIVEADAAFSVLQREHEAAQLPRRNRQRELREIVASGDAARMHLRKGASGPLAEKIEAARTSERELKGQHAEAANEIPSLERHLVSVSASSEAYIRAKATSVQANLDRTRERVANLTAELERTVANRLVLQAACELPEAI